MADKITNYPSALTMHGLDLLDKSNTNDAGVTYNQTESFTVDQLMTYINLNVTVNNLYNIDGTVTGKRDVTMNGFAIDWINGNMRSRSILNNNGFYLEDSLQVEKAGYYYDVGLSSAVLELSNAGGTYLTAVDGFLGIGIAAPSSIVHIVGAGLGSGTTGLAIHNSSGINSSLVVNDLGTTGMGTTSSTLLNERLTIKSEIGSPTVKIGSVAGASAVTAIGFNGDLSIAGFNVGGGNGNNDLYLNRTAQSDVIRFRYGGSTDQLVVGNDDVAMNTNLMVGSTTLVATAKIHAEQSSLTGAIPTLKLDQADLSEEFIDFVATEAVGNPIEDAGAKTLTTTKFIKVSVNGVNLYIPAGTIA